MWLIPKTHSLRAREDSGFIQALHILPHEIRGLGAPFTALSRCDPRSPCRAGSQKVEIQTPLSGQHSPASGSGRASLGREATSGALAPGPSAAGRPEAPSPRGPRASDAGKCPHPGNPRRTAAAAAAATRSGRQNGGGSDGLVLRGEPGPRDPASGRAGRPQPPRRVSPPCPIRNPERR